jgi:hypothetical protein
MMMKTAVPERVATLHEYNIVPMVGATHEYPYRYVGQWKRESTGLARAVGAAIRLMGERPDVDQVRIYHSYPSPGPVRRYVGAVNRHDMALVRPA